MQLLRERDSSIVVGQLTSSTGRSGGQRDTVVDVQDAVGAAGGPNGGSCLNRVLLGINLAVYESTAAGSGHAGRGLKHH
jgi:hypothetical protein